MRLALPRAWYARTLLVAAGVAALVTTVLLTAFVQYASLLPLAGVRAAVVDAPVAQRTLLVSGSAGADAEQFADQDAAVRELMADGLAGVPVEVATGAYAAGQQLPSFGDADALVAHLADLPEHARLAAGRWPEPARGDEPLQAALPVAVADDLEVAVGDDLVIADGINQQQHRTVIVGLWEPEQPEAAYWQLVSSRIDAGMTGPFVVHPDEFVSDFPTLASQLWVVEADPGDLAAAGMADVLAGLTALEARLMHQRVVDPALAENSRIRTDMGELADRLVLATVVNRSGLILPAALLAVIAGYGLVLVARLLAAHRRGENALLRARGSSRRQLVRFTAAEAAMVVAPAAVLGAPAGTWLVSYADQQAGERSLGIGADVAPYGVAGPPLAWVIALVAAVGCAVALAAPAAGRGRTWVAEQQERSRPGKLAVAQRAGADVALVALALLAWAQLRQYGSAVTPRDVGGLGVDPLLVAAPVVGVLAATAVALRLLPLATRWGVRLAGRRDAFPTLLGMWQADRRPHAGPVLLLVLAVATAVLAPSVAATWQQSQRDQAAQLVGADLRLTAEEGSTVVRAGELVEHPDVAASMPAQRSVALLPGGVRSTLLALDSQRAAQVTRLREDVSDRSPEELFSPLHDGRPALDVAPLPEGVERLTGRIEFRAPEPLLLDIGGFFPFPIFVVETQRMWLYVIDRHGVIVPVRVGLPEPGQGLDLDVELPPGTVALVGMSAGLTIQSFGEVRDGEVVIGNRRVSLPEPLEVSWHWDLAVASADGDPVAVELPDSWLVGFPPGELPRPQEPHYELAGGDVAVVTDLDPTEHRNMRQSFLLAGPLPDGTALPAVATPDVLEAAGAEVGDVIRLGDSDVRLVDTMAVLPGTEDGTGVAVDLPWLSVQQFRSLGAMPEVTEWWLATGSAGALVTAASSQGLRVLDQDAEARRLLDDPLGSGVLLALWIAAAAGALLAAFGLAVDARANAVRRGRELAVLHTLGASPPALARALVVEQAVLAGLGVLAGVAVGVGVAATMGTSLVLTPTGAVPVPEPLLTLSPALFAVPTAGLFVVAVVLGGLVARRARRDIVAGALRIGED